jgi:hypothetical protein
MAKFKPAKGKAKGTRAPQGAVGCVILVIAGLVLLMLFMYFAMRTSGA